MTDRKLPKQREPKAPPVTEKIARRNSKTATGSTDDDFSRRLIRRVGSVLWVLKTSAPGDVPDHIQELRAALVAMEAFQPQDEIEGMLAAQAVAQHAAMMELARRAMLPDQPHEIAQDYRHAMVKLNRGFIEVLDALDRKRGKNRKQVMRIERVTVEAGGQAIVGNVAPSSATGGGGSLGTEFEVEPHAPRPRLEADASIGAVLPPLLGPDTERELVPRSGDAREGPLPHARRCQHRSAHG